MKTIRSTQMGSPSPPSRTSTLSSAPNYPCPSDVNVADFVPLKLCPTNYFVWKQLMLNFIESRGLVGFVDGTIQPPSLPEGKEKEEEYKSWQRSDNLVKVWISVMVTEKILQVVVRLKTAREVWNELEKMFTLPFQQPVDEFDIASSFLQSHPNLASMEPSPLVILAAQRSSFRSGTRLNFLQQLIYDGIPLKSEGISNHHKGRDIENPADGVVSPLDLRKKLHGMFWKVAEKLVPPIKSIRETKLIHHQALELVKSLCDGVVKSDFSKAGEIFIAPLRNATRVGIHEVVEEILESFPSGIHLRSEKDQTIFHLAIVFRREKVFNIIYQLGEGRHRFLSIPDSTTNNALHSAGNLEPEQQLSLRASAAGAALQMQRELQWFKEVEKLILPQAREHMNAEEKTPLDVFTETHKDLVKEGETWMKDTATSCTIVAALVATVVFAAAITFPGGTNSDTGLPIFLEDQAFILFSISDALALFSSTASVLMFLSILTSRYGEQDFLYSLPRRLIIGLVTLFLSIISMMVAFGATLKIVFGDNKSWIVIPVAVLSCVPVTLFALLQFPLLLDMIQSTYYPGIFRKQSNRILD